MCECDRMTPIERQGGSFKKTYIIMHCTKFIENESTLPSTNIIAEADKSITIGVWERHLECVIYITS